jgi:hypothetical protein
LTLKLDSPRIRLTTVPCFSSASQHTARAPGTNQTARFPLVFIFRPAKTKPTCHQSLLERDLHQLISGPLCFAAGNPSGDICFPISRGDLPERCALELCLSSFFGVAEMYQIFAVSGVAALMMAFLFFVLPTLSMKTR